ncbi:MAG: isoprenylcysteine carboxylmethyltransferase family protein [Bdellovibrionales bacterium]|nr:isoprenylcysteine carboxylmethyltransferase family protein [Bdellovibrionales bacterium]
MNDKGPGVKFPPPLLLLACLSAGYALHQFMPLYIDQTKNLMLIAGFFAFIGLTLIIGCCVQFLKAKTHLEPWKESKNLITSGIFRFSRNPIYLGFFFIGISIAVYFNSFWMIISLIPFYFLIQLFVIRKEEKYLRNKFKEAYDQYCKKVRRWF